jgi:acetyl esterase/lipase/lysophospholipase L1-like esterase
MSACAGFGKILVTSSKTLDIPILRRLLMKAVRFGCCLSLAVLFLGGVVLGAVDEASVLALSPEPQTAEWSKSWWMPRHEQKLAEAQKLKGQVDLLFIGDSITHGWESGGKTVWNQFYANRRPFNIGFSGDRTEHVLWRFQHGEIDGLIPKVAVVMIGTNNTGHRQDKPEDTSAGVAAIIDELKQRTPATKVLLLGIFPRGDKPTDALRQINDRINESLKTLADNERVFFLSLDSVFLENDGTLPRVTMPDALHPNGDGYRLWAQGMEPTLKKLLGEKPKLPEPIVLPLWPEKVPGETTDQEESLQPDKGDQIMRVTHVSKPTLAVYKAPNQRNPVGAVMVCPGGGYNILAYDLEGTEIAEWLNSIGMTAVVLKYRVPQNREGAIQDAQRGLGLIRSNAKAWGINPDHVGVLGFSAGGHLSASLSTHYSQRLYTAIDGADALSCRPDFTVLVYPAYLGTPEWDLRDDIPVTQDTPPAFIVQTQDDKRLVPSSLAYYKGLSQVGVQAELHLFPTGGHGYGMRPSVYPVSQWPTLCETWIKRLPMKK